MFCMGGPARFDDDAECEPFPGPNDASEPGDGPPSPPPPPVPPSGPTRFGFAATLLVQLVGEHEKVYLSLKGSHGPGFS